MTSGSIAANLVRMRARTDAADSSFCRRLIVVPRRDLSLDFVNTVAWRGSTQEESLHTAEDLLKWFVSAGIIDGMGAAGFQKFFEARPTLSAAIFTDAITIRETLYRLLRSLAIGSSPAAEDLHHFNAVLSNAPSRALLDHAKAGVGWRIEVKATAASLLTPVLWSAADILVAAPSVRLRECANERCLWLFFDDSKNGSRRWCSMQSCGNRAKAHRHYLRQKKQ